MQKNPHQGIWQTRKLSDIPLHSILSNNFLLHNDDRSIQQYNTQQYTIYMDLSMNATFWNDRYWYVLIIFRHAHFAIHDQIPKLVQRTKVTSKTTPPFCLAGIPKPFGTSFNEMASLMCTRAAAGHPNPTPYTSSLWSFLCHLFPSLIFGDVVRTVFFPFPVSGAEW